MGKRKSQEQFEQDVYIRLGDQYEILSPYPGSHGKVKLKHLKCGNIFMKNVHDIITKSSGCPFCNGTKPALYNEQWIINNTPLPYHYISGYTTMKSKCVFHCDNCNSDFLQLPSRLINEHIYGCNCCPTKKWTHKQFLENLGEECLKNYTILENYINSDTKIKIRHNKCGTEFQLSPYNFIYKHHKQYCPICFYNKSKGEIIINQFLEKNKIEYQKEFIFPTLPKRKFDFYLPELKTAIEFDGEQHYKYIPFFFNNDKNNFITLQQRDQEKNKFCIDNNIILFRIPYYEIENLEIILKKIFEEKSSTTIEKFIVKID